MWSDGAVSQLMLRDSPVISGQFDPTIGGHVVCRRRPKSDILTTSVDGMTWRQYDVVSEQPTIPVPAFPPPYRQGRHIGHYATQWLVISETVPGPFFIFQHTTHQLTDSIQPIILLSTTRTDPIHNIICGTVFLTAVQIQMLDIMSVLDAPVWNYYYYYYYLHSYKMYKQTLTHVQWKQQRRQTTA